MAPNPGDVLSSACDIRAERTWQMDGGWPELDFADWQDTAETLQLWTQIVGKVRLALTPWLNHGWQVPLYVSARGLTTSLIPAGALAVDIEFDFIDHRLVCRSSGGDV